MEWLILTTRGMPSGMAIAVVYGDVEALRELPMGDSNNIPEAAWQRLRDDMLEESQSSLGLDS